MYKPVIILWEHFDALGKIFGTVRVFACKKAYTIVYDLFYLNNLRSFYVNANA